MNSASKFTLALVLAVLFIAPLSSIADTEDAFCEVRGDGDKAANASGFCTVSLREGSVTIELADGERFELAPGEHAGRFQDQNGDGVDHKVRQDGSHDYRWEHRSITIYFDRDEGKFH